MVQKIKRIIFLSKKFYFSLPVQKSVLIWDMEGSSVLAEILEQENITFEFCAIRGERINFFVFILSLFDFSDFSFQMSYSKKFIKFTRPKLVLTCIDNSETFLSLKKYFPEEYIFAVVQNGWRNQWGDLNRIDITGKDLRVDYSFVMNNGLGSCYHKMYGAESVVIGSIRSNAIKKCAVDKSNDVLYISQYRNAIHEQMGSNERFQGVLITEYVQSELSVINAVLNWARQNSMKLSILGCSVEHSKAEKQFYLRYFPQIEIIENSDVCSYEIVDRHAMVVFVDSTLGYEAIGRGVKCVSINPRLERCGKSRPFGWPMINKPEGFCWVSSLDDRDWALVLDRVHLMEEEEWLTWVARSCPDLVRFDPGNSTIRRYLKKYG